MSPALAPLVEDLPGVLCSESLACDTSLACSDMVSLALAVERTETLILVTENVETLGLMGEIIRSSEFLHAGPNTYPSSTTWPGQYGNITGHAFGLLNETPETLAPLVEV